MQYEKGGWRWVLRRKNLRKKRQMHIFNFVACVYGAGLYHFLFTPCDEVLVDVFQLLCFSLMSFDE